MKSQIDSRSVGIQQPRNGDFLLFNISGSEVHISGLLYSLLQWKKNAASLCARGKGEGALARRQADCWLYLLVCFFFLVYQPPKSKKITTAPTKKLKSQWNTVTFGGFHHGNCRAEPAVHNTGPTIPNACKWRIYLRDLCQELTCGRLANAKMGYSMDKKEVNSSNFTFKNLYKPLDVCARRYEIVSRLVDHFKNDLGKKKNACALS